MEYQWPPKTSYKCKLCNDIIQSRYKGEYRTCKCGEIAVDQNGYYSRIMANDLNNLEEIEHEASV